MIILEELYLIIGEHLRNRRIELRLNQKDLSDSVGINRTSISNIENGRHQAPLHLLYKICNSLELDLLSILPSYDELEGHKSNADGDMSYFNVLSKKLELSDTTKLKIEEILNKLD